MMRPGDTQLKTKVDEFLLARQFTRRRQHEFTDDLPGLIERGRLRMITRNNAMTYFIHRGLQVGFEYELMKKFASEHGLRLEIVIPGQPRRTAGVFEPRQGGRRGRGHDHNP